MHKKDLGVGAVSVAFGAWIYYMTTTMKAKAAFWPKIVAGGIIILGVIIIANALLDMRKVKSNPPQTSKKPKEKPNYPRVLAIIVMLVIYYFLFTRFSYIIATILLMIGTSAILGYRNWKVLIPTAVITSVLLYVAFSQLFNVHFPGVFF